jgi:hypothetical protein
MARRRPAAPRARPRRGVTAADPTSPWPHLQGLIDDAGSFVIGRIDPIPCVAVASDAHIMYAALVRRDGETLTQLLDRLDAALAKAFATDDYTDEING